MLQHAFFDRGKVSYKDILLIRILLNISDNRLVYNTLSLSIRNQAMIEKLYINSLVYYRERELNLLIFTTLVSNTICANISETFIHHNHFIIYRSYHLLCKISISESFASIKNGNIDKLKLSTIIKVLFTKSACTSFLS